MMKKTVVQKQIRTAMVLAAGFGTRMRDLTNEISKPLLPLNDHRIIDIILSKLAAQRIKRVVINLHHLGNQIERHIGNGEQYGLEIFFSKEEILLDTGGGIAFAEHFFNGETILAVNGDVLSNISIKSFYGYHQKNNTLATIAVVPSKNNSDYSLVLYNDQNRLTGFLGKGEHIPNNSQSGIFTGYQILTPKARTYLKPEVQSIIRGFYQAALERNEVIKVFPHKGEWIDLGTKEKYSGFKEDLETGKVDVKKFME